MVELSIIILSYNTKKLTKKCIETVVNSLGTKPSLKAEILVLDNASTDGSIEELKKLKTQLQAKIPFKLILSHENLGYSKGNNKAAQEAEGKNLLFLNSDTEALENAVPLFDDWFNEDKYACAGARLIFPGGKLQQSVGRFYTLPIAFAALFLKADYWGLSRLSPRSSTDVDWVSGAALMFKKNIFTALGGFDENIFMYWEE